VAKRDTRPESPPMPLYYENADHRIRKHIQLAMPSVENVTLHGAFVLAVLSLTKQERVEFLTIAGLFFCPCCGEDLGNFDDGQCDCHNE
jgi:hypothetical protein